jgi:hypothetical protein
MVTDSIFTVTWVRRIGCVVQSWGLGRITWCMAGTAGVKIKVEVRCHAACQLKV